MPPISRGVRWPYVLGVLACWAIGILLCFAAHAGGRWHLKTLVVAVFVSGISFVLMPLVMVWRCRRCRSELGEKLLDFPGSKPADIAPYLELARRGENIERIHLLVGPVGDDTVCVRVESCPTCRVVARVTLGRSRLVREELDGKPVDVHTFRATTIPIALAGEPVRVLMR